MVEQEDMWQQHIPCEGCAPNIQTTPAVVLSGAPPIHFETPDGIPVIVGGIAALTGIVAAFAGHSTVAKVGAGVGVASAMAVLGVVAFRAWRANEFLSGRQLPGDAAEWAQRQTRATFTSAIATSGILATSAIALLVAGRN